MNQPTTLDATPAVTAAILLPHIAAADEPTGHRGLFGTDNRSRTFTKLANAKAIVVVPNGVRLLSERDLERLIVG